MLGTDDSKRKEYTSPKGGKFAIISDQSGLYRIVMENGGVRPYICDGQFTRFKAAEHKLLEYFKANPKPTPREASSKKDS